MRSPDTRSGAPLDQRGVRMRTSSCCKMRAGSEPVDMIAVVASAQAMVASASSAALKHLAAWAER